MMAALRDEAALRELLGQSVRSGAPRRAVVLHTERLPAALSKPHHFRLAREALSSIAGADRAQLFDLSHGRMAIVWRSSGGDELARARTALDLLLAGQPNGRMPALGELLTLYDLPEQAAWLLDEITLADTPAQVASPSVAMDAAQLACLEASLVQADLSRFARWRPIVQLGMQLGMRLGMRLGGGAHGPAWEERYFAVHEIATALCPDVGIKADPWLYRRLTRTLDRRMLALLASPRELRGCGTFAINLNVETILSADFLRFDEALPLALRGEVILNLRAADILADPSGFAFARRFAQARGYRLGLASASVALLRFLDLQEASLDYVHLAYSAELVRSPGEARGLVPEGTQIMVSGLDRPSLVEWAEKQGFVLGRGSALGY